MLLVLEESASFAALTLDNLSGAQDWFLNIPLSPHV